MSVDYAPTGKEFVSGSYDRTVRIFKSDSTGGHSREVYHTKRMQRIFSVRFSADNKYVLTGSDDTNIRLWKAQAADRIRTLLPREQNKRDYLNKLKERYKFHKETSRIARYVLFTAHPPLLHFRLILLHSLSVSFVSRSGIDTCPKRSTTPRTVCV